MLSVAIRTCIAAAVACLYGELAFAADVGPGYLSSGYLVQAYAATGHNLCPEHEFRSRRHDQRPEPTRRSAGSLCDRKLVLASELPLEGPDGGAVMILEAQQAVLQFSARAKGVGRKDFALNDREVHLDLVEPAGVHGRMHGDDGGPAPTQALDAGLTAMRGAVVHDPKDPRGRAVGLLPHDLSDEVVEGRMPVVVSQRP